ncbi:MAG: phage terminase large subunit [Chloroflexi bacterium]|nr:phage terminase large subunit [Chloroflexota bacterium]
MRAATMRKRMLRRLADFRAGRGFRPTERQRELYEALIGGPDPGLTLLGYGGAMGGGKTRAIAELAIDAALMHPGNNILVARHHLSDLSSTTMKEFFQVCPPELIQRRQQAPTSLVQLRLPGWARNQHSTVNFRHLSDWQGLGSQQYGAVLIDEAGQVDEDAALMLLTRLRHPAQPQRWFVAASNPWPGWFQRWFLHRELPEDALREASGQVAFIPAKIADNPHLPDNYAQLNHALLPQQWRDRFIDGRWNALMGRVYPDFDPNRHCWPGPLPPFTHIIGGLDFGGQTDTSHHTAGIIAGLTRSPLPSPPLAGGDGVGRGGVSPLLHSCAGRNHEPPKPINDTTRQPSPSRRHAIPSPPLAGEMPRPFPSPPAPRGEMSRSDRGGLPPSLPSPGPTRPFPSPPLAGGDGAGRGGVLPAGRGGVAHPFTLIRLAEFEDRGPGVIQRLEQWQRQCQQRFGPIRWAADRSQSAWIDHQRRQGIHVVPAAGNPGSVLYGINLVHEPLAAEPPASFYTENLTSFPKRMQEYVWQTGDDPDPKPRKKNDDLLDADRYMHELLQQVPHPTGRPGIQLIHSPRGIDARWRPT